MQAKQLVKSAAKVSLTTGLVLHTYGPKREYFAVIGWSTLHLYFKLWNMALHDKRELLKPRQVETAVHGCNFWLSV